MAGARSAAVRIGRRIERRAGDRVVEPPELTDGEIVWRCVARHITCRERRIDVADRQIWAAIETEIECIDQEIDVVFQADVDMDAAAGGTAAVDRQLEIDGCRRSRRRTTEGYQRSERERRKTHLSVRLHRKPFLECIRPRECRVSGIESASSVPSSMFEQNQNAFVNEAGKSLPG